MKKQLFYAGLGATIHRNARNHCFPDFSLFATDATYDAPFSKLLEKTALERCCKGILAQL